jgi:hypothetical protein
MTEALIVELARRDVINGMIDRIILDTFDQVINCHVHVRRGEVQAIIRERLGLKDSYQLRRAVTERMAALGFRPVQLHGRGFYKHAKYKPHLSKGGAHDYEKGIKS